MSDKNSVFDVRVVERNIAGGVISESDFEEHIKEINDSSDNAEFVTSGEEEEEDKNQE